MSKNDLYLDNGYLNIEYILKFKMPFNWIVGGRGTGKTYGALKYCYENSKKFIYLRRTQTQIDLIVNNQFNPFKTINKDLNINIGCYPLNKYNKGFFIEEWNDDKDRFEPVGEPLGYGMALSTISNLRGFDASAVDVLIFDEFIYERHERPIKNEADAFLNGYETMNRNRELNNIEPIQCLFCANANNLANPLFLKLNLVLQASRQIRNHVEFAQLPKRDSTMTILQESKISEEKKNTALYRLAKGTSFEAMSLENKFVYDDVYHVGHKNLKEYRPLVTYKELTIYKHKSRDEYYVSEHQNGTPKRVYGDSIPEGLQFARNERHLYRAFLLGKMWFEHYANQVVFEEYFK